MTEPSTPTEPVEPTEPDVDPTEPAPDTETPETPETPAETPATEPATASGEGEWVTGQEDTQFDAPEEQHISRVPSIETQRKRQDKDKRAIQKENARHALAIQKIMGEDAAYNVACPLCNSLAPPISADDQLVEVDARDQAGEMVSGYLWVTDGSVIGEGKLAQLKTLLGLGQPSALKPHPTTHECETCDGWGEVSTGSKLQHHDKLPCPICKGKGWEGLGVPVTDLPQTNGSSEPSTLTGPTVYTSPDPVDTFDDDPDVQALRRRGFLVVRPMATPAV